jgi:hypothetical protein
MINHIKHHKMEHRRQRKVLDEYNIDRTKQQEQKETVNRAIEMKTYEDTKWNQ